MRDLSQPTLENLSYLLRHKGLWPDGFVWDFSAVGGCAIGLAIAQKWLPRKAFFQDMTRVFGMPRDEVDRICHDLGWNSRVGNYRKVGPIKVANAIDKYLAKTVA